MTQWRFPKASARPQGLIGRFHASSFMQVSQLLFFDRNFTPLN